MSDGNDADFILSHFSWLFTLPSCILCMNCLSAQQSQEADIAATLTAIKHVHA